MAARVASETSIIERTPSLATSRSVAEDYLPRAEAAVHCTLLVHIRGDPGKVAGVAPGQLQNHKLGSVVRVVCKDERLQRCQARPCRFAEHQYFGPQFQFPLPPIVRFHLRNQIHARNKLFMQRIFRQLASNLRTRSGDQDDAKTSSCFHRSKMIGNVITCHRFSRAKSHPATHSKRLAA